MLLSTDPPCNFNGLGNKFDQLYNFIKTTNLDIDIIGISETSQKENIDFNTNVSIDGYHLPFVNGSKTAKGGVAIYARENIIIWERDDLNIVNNDFESVWTEIEVKNSKNIICGCFYRHPTYQIDNFSNYISKCL